MKIYVLILILAATLILAGCTQIGGQVEREYVCSDGSVVKIASQCPPPQVAQQQDPEMKTCEDMPEIERMPFSDYCYTGLAYKRENATICKKVSESYKSGCYSGLAVFMSDITVCDAAGTQKNSCYSNYASEKADVTACDKITDISFKDSCYSQYASRYSDATVCEKIRMSGTKDNCYMNLARQQCDSSLCDKVINTNNKDQCLRDIQYCGGQYQPTKEVQPG